MATINDKDSGTSVKISSLGSMLVTEGDDGYPTFFAKIYHPRLTSSFSANTLVWALRAPVNRTVIVRSGQVCLSLDTTPATIAEIAVDMVRFKDADPTGGTLLQPARMRTVDAASQTTMIRNSTASLGLTMPATATVEPTTTGFFHLSIPALAGASTFSDLEAWSGLELGPGEGLAIYTRGGNAPIGFQTTGWIQFSEKE